MAGPPLGSVARAPAVLAAVAALALAARLAGHGYQTFIDKYPVDRFDWDNRAGYGPTSATREPFLSNSFDWRIDWQPNSDRLRVIRPNTVLVYGNDLHRLRHNYGVLLDDSGKDKSLVIWGDRLLSTMFTEGGSWQEDVLWAWTRFRRVACQAKDLPVDYIHTAPMGIGEMYLRGQVWKTAEAAMSAARLQRKHRTADVHDWHRPLGQRARNVLATEGLRLSLEAVRTLPPSYRAIGASRETAVRWAQSLEAVRMRVEYRAVPASRWWHELSTYRFLVSPHGLAVQSTKSVEALMVLTVPIVQRAPAHEDLVRLGFPLLIVDTWDNITAELLDAAWAGLSPRLQSFRANCLTAEAYWKFSTGELQACH